MKNQFIAAVALVSLCITSACFAYAHNGRVPRCWVQNCRGAYGERCIACIMAHCGNGTGSDAAAIAWCNTRPRINWPAGTPGR